jgi:predicted RNase H-like HicB family nuclease
MLRNFTLQYWIDDGWYVGRLPEAPGVFSQGQSLEELEDNIREVYRLMGSA